MIKTLKLHNFKTFLNASVEFKPVHLLIGKNNSGKTNLCTALRFLAWSATGELRAAATASVPGGTEELTNWKLNSNRFQLECVSVLDLDDDELEFQYKLTLRVQTGTNRFPQEGPSLSVEEEHLQFVDGNSNATVTLLKSDGVDVELLDEESFEKTGEATYTRIPVPHEATILSKLYGRDSNRRTILFRNSLWAIRYYALSPFAIRHFWKESPQSDIGLSVAGDNLAGALFRQKNWDEQRYRRVIDFVRETAEPDLEAINFVTAPNQSPIPMVALRNRARASWAGLSDGTLRVLAFANVVEESSAMTEQGLFSTIIIEEPENGIYPGQLRSLLELIENRAPASQFIFTSHSPYVINMFDHARDSVSILTRNEERTQIASPPAADISDPDRPLLAEQYTLELLGK